MLKYILNIFFIIFIFLGCGQELEQTDSKSETTSLDKIKEYADSNTSEIPEINDYINLNITSVDSTNINAINQKVDSLESDDVNTVEKVKSIVDAILDNLNINNLEIVAINYANKSTLRADDDVMYIYFNKYFSYNTIHTSLRDKFDLNGTGRFGDNDSKLLSNNIFPYLKVSLSATAGEFDTNNTKISIAKDTITDENGNYPLENNPKIALIKYNALASISTLNNICINTKLEDINCSDENASKTDGTYNSSAIRNFDSMTSDIIIDLDSGLTWHNLVPTDTYTYEEAENFCKISEINNNTNWRLPTIKELISITSKGNIFPAMASSQMIYTPSYITYSSTNVTTNDNNVLGINFSEGSIVTILKTSSNLVRCVHE